MRVVELQFELFVPLNLVQNSIIDLPRICPFVSDDEARRQNDGGQHAYAVEEHTVLAKYADLPIVRVQHSILATIKQLDDTAGTAQIWIETDDELESAHKGQHRRHTFLQIEYRDWQGQR